MSFYLKKSISENDTGALKIALRENSVPWEELLQSYTEACRQGRFKTVKVLLNHLISSNILSSEREKLVLHHSEAFVEACKSGNSKLVKYFLYQFPDFSWSLENQASLFASLLQCTLTENIRKEIENYRIKYCVSDVSNNSDDSLKKVALTKEISALTFEELENWKKILPASHLLFKQRLEEARIFKEEHLYADDSFNGEVSLATIIDLQKLLEHSSELETQVFFPSSPSKELQWRLQNLYLQIRSIDSLKLSQVAFKLENYANSERLGNVGWEVRIDCIEKEQIFFRKWIFASKFAKEVEELPDLNLTELKVVLKEVLLWFLLRWKNADSIQAYYLQKIQIDFLYALGYPLSPQTF